MRICPKCGKKMIKRYENFILATNPPQYPWYWWCGCGHIERGGIDRGMDVDELYRRIWETTNVKD